MKKLYTFDFDDTLFFTPSPEDGKEIWESKMKTNWPYNGWWSKSETIDLDIFHIPINHWVYSKYLEAIKDEDSYVILATGRLNKVQNMRKNIERILNENNLSFDEIHLNWGGDTYNFKTKLFEELIEKTNCSEIIMYDDRHEHLKRFYDWAKNLNCKSTIIDVKSKKITKNDN